MAAAEITETLVGGLGSEIKTTGTALKLGVYTATVATQNDWVIFGNYTKVVAVYAVVTSSGVINPTTIDGTTLNKVVFTSASTGAVTCVVIGY